MHTRVGGIELASERSRRGSQERVGSSKKVRSLASWLRCDSCTCRGIGSTAQLVVVCLVHLVHGDGVAVAARYNLQDEMAGKC